MVDKHCLVTVPTKPLKQSLPHVRSRFNQFDMLVGFLDHEITIWARDRNAVVLGKARNNHGNPWKEHWKMLCKLELIRVDKKTEEDPWFDTPEGLSQISIKKHPSRHFHIFQRPRSVKTHTERWHRGPWGSRNSKHMNSEPWNFHHLERFLWGRCFCFVGGIPNFRFLEGYLWYFPCWFPCWKELRYFGVLDSPLSVEMTSWFILPFPFLLFYTHEEWNPYDSTHVLNAVILSMFSVLTSVLRKLI